MNKHIHRLVFSRRHGMHIAVAEHARAHGRGASGARRAALSALAAGLALVSPVAQAQAQATAQRPPVVYASKLPPPATPLPQPNTSTTRSFAYDPARGDPLRGGSSPDLLKTGQVSWTAVGNTATFNQGSLDRVVLNWDSFNIGAGYKVHFAQNKDPSRYVSALNRVWSADPSVILGSLTADREVVLLNANGVYFGRGARVDTGRFVATANALADAVFEKGLRNVTDGSAVFGTEGIDYQRTNLDAFVSVEDGAEIRSAAGGDVLLVAPRVVNRGRIETPRGQAVLAAGDKVYLMSSSDPAQRGLIVAVDPVKAEGSTTLNDPTLGIVENAAQGSYKTVDGATVAEATPDTTSGLVKKINEIRADSGTVNLVGLAVRQAGQINATTAVKGANGAIYLQAMASTGIVNAGAGADRWGLKLEPGARARVGANLGSVEVLAGSVTAVMPDTGGATQIDAEVFNRSRIRVEGAAIAVGSGARLQAPAGQIDLLAATLAQLGPATFDLDPQTLLAGDDGSRIVVAPGALVSVAGLRDVAVDGQRNQGSQRLFRIELADAPVQRSGPLYRSQVQFDLRDAGQIGAANVTGAAAAIARTAAERSTAGGSIRIESEGTVVVGSGARLDVAGGSVHYSQATLTNTLLAQGGRAVVFRSAVGGNSVDAVLGEGQRTVSPAYTEGQAGGSLSLNGRVVALAGELHGDVVQGERQRAGSAARAAASVLTLGRGIGSNFYLGGIALQPGSGAALDDALFADPLGSSLNGLPATTALSLAAVQQSGFGSLVLRAKEVSQTGAAALDLGLRGALDVRAHRIDLDGSFAAAGGTLALATLSSGEAALSGREDIHLGAGTTLDAAGRWSNDTAAGTAAPAPVDGGRVTLASAHSVLLDAGATVDVSAGAQLAAGGSVTRGKAGSVTLRATRLESGPAAQLQLAGARLLAHDFGSGGRLTLGVPGALTVASGVGTDGFTLAPAFFAAGGFGNIAVDADGDLRFAAGTRLAPQLLNWQFAEGYRAADSGRMSAAVATPQRVDTQLADRSPVNLAFAATRTLGIGPGQIGASVSIERGAGIELDADGKLAINATRNIDVGARGGVAGQPSALRAPGGQISLQIDGQRGAVPDPGSAGSGDPVGFLADQALWIGADAQLSVAGTAVLRPDRSTAASPGSAGAGGSGTRITGQVFGGGTISLNAQRGYVVAAAGSKMVLDGAAADLHFAGLAGAATVARAAGTLKVSTPEGYTLEGAVSAQAPRDTQGRALAEGGRLDLAVGAGGVLTATDSGRLYPGTLVTAANLPIPGAVAKPRQVVVGGAEGLLRTSGAQPGADLDAALDNGIGHTPAALLSGAGFGNLRLASGDTVRFENNLDLSFGQRLQFDTPALTARPGTQVSLAAATIALGDGVNPVNGRVPADLRAAADTSTGTATTLRLQAPSIDIVGNSALQGFATVTLDAGAGEVRLMGRGSVAELSSADALQGTLNFAGALRLDAAQVYTTSGAGFTFNGLVAGGADDAGSRFTVVAPEGGALPRLPLSAFGALTVNATDIAQQGVLRQPYGSITLNAARMLELAEGSVTSVSGLGLAQIYGSTDNLSRWLLPNSQFGSQLPLSKGVQLRAGRFETSVGATVDARAGGDILAWEFFKGVGGSSDYFLTDGLYAVLPDYAGTRALALGGGRLDAAQQDRQLVVTMAGSALAPGRYDLLPARYALMAGTLPQGAFLVRRAASQGSTVLAAPLRQDDGSVLVTGYLASPGSVAVGAPGERFVVEAPVTFGARSEVRLTSVSTLLGQQTAGAGPRGLPRDGGQVQVTMSGSDGALWQAALKLGADSGGGGAGRLDLSATHVALIDDPARAAPDALAIGAQALTDSGAGSVLLGGQRSAVGAGVAGSAPQWSIDRSLAADVAVDIGARPLQLEELVLTASGRVDLAAGTTIQATRAATQGARTLSASGDGAVAVVSANAIELQRSGATLAGGDLAVGAGTTLQGAQVSLDATGRLAADRSTQIDSTRLNLGARRIVVGDGAPADAQATVLAGELLATARAAPALTLRSFNGIDFVGTQDWAQRAVPGDVQSAPTVVAQSLVLDAPRLRGLAGPDGTPARTDIAARDITLRNATGQGATLEAGQGTLLLQALPPLRYGRTGGLVVAQGSQALAFADAALHSAGDIVLQGTGSTQAQGDLRLAAARVTVGNGADQALVANAGTLRVERETGSRSLGERVGQGAKLLLSGRAVRQDGVLDLPGSALRLAAGGAADIDTALRFGAGSLTSVAGFALPGHDGFEAHGAPGSIVARAAQGGIEVLGTLDVSAAARSSGAAGDAGRIELQAAGARGALAVSGTLQGRAGSGAADRGGGLKVDVTALPSTDALAGAASAGGLDREFAVRVRTGDVTMAGNVAAERVLVSADGGRLDVAGATLDARSATGGVVQLNAAADVVLRAGSRIDARSSRSGANGGDVLLGSAAGRVRIAGDAVVDATGDDASDGRIVLRAQRGADNASVQVETLNGSNLRAAGVDIEAVRVYRSVGSGTAVRDIAGIAATTNATAGVIGQNTVRADTAAFMANAGAVLAGLGVGAADAGRVVLRAGVEVRAAGDLAVSAAWQNKDPENATPASRRPNEDAGFLTLRAAGNLNVNGTLSDGFTTATAAGVLLANSPRDWSLRLVAGADLAAADPLAVRDLSAAGTETAGNVTVAGNQFVRTGAGAIDMAAGRNIVFASGSNAPGLAYVAGRRMAGGSELLSNLFAGQGNATTGLGKPVFTEQGGRLTLQAARDIYAAEATQLVNNWLWRSGLPGGEPGLFNAQSQPAWWSEFSRLRQTVGSFGGGDLLASAGRDIVNLQAMVPTVGWADSRGVDDARLVVRNGGDLDVRAVGNVAGGQFLLGRGEGRIGAGGSIVAASGNTRVQDPALALLDGQWRLAARDSLATTGAFDPTALPVPTADARQGASGFFYSWGAGAALDLVANAGALAVTGLTGTRADSYALGAGVGSYAAVQPPSLRATAAGGNLSLPNVAQVMFPASRSDLRLWAGGDIAQGQVLAMADSAPALWPDFTRPLPFAGAGPGILTGLVATTVADTLPHAAVHLGDAEPVQIHAEGSIRNGRLNLPKQARISAGVDITELQLTGQNLGADDFSTVTAGRDFLAALPNSGITVAGPGALEVTAGRDVDLGASGGITTIGNQRNASLPGQGASVKLVAAAKPTLDLAAFEATYLAGVTDGGSERAAQYREALRDSVRQSLGRPDLDEGQALALFRGFPAEAQASLARQVLNAEFGATYLSGTPPTAAQMTERLRGAFERNKALVLQAGDAALLAGRPLTLPGREVLQGAALLAYLTELRALAFTSLDLDSTVAARVASLARVDEGWREAVARSLGGSAAAFDALSAQDAQDPRVLAYRAALGDFSGRRFEAYRGQVLASEAADAGAAASLFGRRSLPMRLALFDQGFRAAELAGAGSFVAQPIWPGQMPVMGYSGAMELTQSAVVTERGGGIMLVNAGGAVNVGLKEAASARSKGVIALGGGDIFGYARDDFQVNTQRVFIVGQGNMNIWSSSGDIDSGRGANTAVAAPPLAARRSADGIVFEVPATTTGSGLGILEDIAGRRAGSIGLYPAFGEILALDAFIRAPSVVLGAAVKGADNLISASVGGAAAPVSAPVLAVAPPPANTDNKAGSAPLAGQAGAEGRPRNALLTVELLGLGAAEDDRCEDKERVDGKCPPPAKK